MQFIRFSFFLNCWISWQYTSNWSYQKDFKGEPLSNLFQIKAVWEVFNRLWHFCLFLHWFQFLLLQKFSVAFSNVQATFNCQIFSDRRQFYRAWFFESAFTISFYSTLSNHILALCDSVIFPDILLYWNLSFCLKEVNLQRSWIFIFILLKDWF